jgi:hypothetical protein
MPTAQISTRGTEELRGTGVLSPVAWEPRRRLDLEEWLLHGRRMGSIGRGSAWWIGDWVNYGNAAFGEKYTRASRITGYDVQSLMNMAYVASRFELSRRRENLSWSHHAELAALPAAEQDGWLDRAARAGLSVRRLREALRESRSRPAARSTARVAEVCPNCGHRMEAAGD